jgi:hypothetical protein
MCALGGTCQIVFVVALLSAALPVTLVSCRAYALQFGCYALKHHPSEATAANYRTFDVGVSPQNYFRYAKTDLDCKPQHGITTFIIEKDFEGFSTG